jgi:hypothetical protein
MKKSFLFILLFSFFAFSQSEIEVENILSKKYPFKDLYVGENWVFRKQYDSIKKFDVPLISSKLKTKEFYITHLSFVGDHFFDPFCIIMYNTLEKNLIMFPPKWFSGIPQEFYKEFIGIELNNIDEIKQFASEFELIVMNDSGIEKLRKKEIDSNSIIYSSGLQHQDNLFDIIKIIIKNGKVDEIQRLSAKDFIVEERIN